MQFQCERLKHAWKSMLLDSGHFACGRFDLGQSPQGIRILQEVDFHICLIASQPPIIMAICSH